MGAQAVDLLLDGETEKMVGFTKNQIQVFDINTAIKSKKTIDYSELELAHIMAGL